MPDNAPSTPVAAPEPTPEPLHDAPKPDDRTELLHRARAFLTSPQVQNEDVAAKRRFLVEKGLNDVEVEGLLRELVSGIPKIFRAGELTLARFSPLQHRQYRREHTPNRHPRTCPTC